MDNKLKEKKTIRNMKVWLVTLSACIGTVSLCKVSQTNTVAAIDFFCGIMGGAGIGYTIKSIVDDNNEIKEMKKKK